MSFHEKSETMKICELNDKSYLKMTEITSLYEAVYEFDYLAEGFFEFQVRRDLFCVGSGHMARDNKRGFG